MSDQRKMMIFGVVVAAFVAVVLVSVIGKHKDCAASGGRLMREYMGTWECIRPAATQPAASEGPPCAS